MHNILNHDLSLEITHGLQAIGHAGRLQPGLSLGIKTTWQNRFGAQEDVLLFSQTGWPGGELPPPEAWSCLRLAQLRQILTLRQVDPGELVDLVNECRTRADSTLASASALMHAAFAPEYTCFCQPPALMAGFAGGMIKVKSNQEPALPFEADLLSLCRQISMKAPGLSELVLNWRGVLLGASTFSGCLTHLEKCETGLQAQSTLRTTGAAFEEKLTASFAALKELRTRLSSLRSRPLVLHLDDSDAMLRFVASPAARKIAGRGLPFPDFFSRTGKPLLIDGGSELDRDLPIESQAETTIILQPGLGVVAFGSSPEEALRSAEVFHAGVQAIADSNPPAAEIPPDPSEVSLAAEWERVKPPARLPFSGEIALVTGAASGIGKAIVQSLLERGSAVAGVDINPTIINVFDHPSYHGFVCDVASEASVCQTINAVVHWAGGLDMLILNAGMFPSGCDINKMDLAEFSRVINVNFIANMMLMREAHPLLSKAPRYGRVVVVGSRNMRAPGPGASAYSTSKAAVTQLARVAALEWGGDRIRVNVIHPDSVFDTGLYTEEVLQARSAHYGMTVEQYKKRNLLKTEITSRDVAELVAEMCGPLFRHMTGGQIQLDGGNDRTL